MSDRGHQLWTAVGCREALVSTIRGASGAPPTVAIGGPKCHHVIRPILELQWRSMSTMRTSSSSDSWKLKLLANKKVHDTLQVCKVWFFRWQFRLYNKLLVFLFKQPCHRWLNGSIKLVTHHMFTDDWMLVGHWWSNNAPSIYHWWWAASGPMVAQWWCASHYGWADIPTFRHWW